MKPKGPSSAWGESAAPSFLGTGWGFPPEFTAGGADVVLVSDVEDIHQSLQILLATSLGERVMHEDYGCDLSTVLFEEMDQALVNRVSGLVTDAILYHEPRIELLSLDVFRDRVDAGRLRLHLAYAVLGTNSRFNMVYPFYLTQATVPGL